MIVQGGTKELTLPVCEAVYQLFLTAGQHCCRAMGPVGRHKNSIAFLLLLAWCISVRCRLAKHAERDSCELDVTACAVRTVHQRPRGTFSADRREQLTLAQTRRLCVRQAGGWSTAHCARLRIYEGSLRAAMHREAGSL